MTRVQMLQSATHSAAHIRITGCILKVGGIGRKNLRDVKLDRKQKRHGAGGGGCEDGCWDDATSGEVRLCRNKMSAKNL